MISDECKNGFGAVLAQQFTLQLPLGDTRTTIHPIGFASKCTSPAEERYKLYLLEFAALKLHLTNFDLPGVWWASGVQSHSHRYMHVAASRHTLEGITQVLLCPLQSTVLTSLCQSTHKCEKEGDKRDRACSY
jgi:hypothetical protein